jgi:hypothetical protein
LFYDKEGYEPMVVLTYVFEKFLSAYSFIRPRKSFKIGVVEIVDFLS